MSYTVLITVMAAFYGCLWFFDSVFRSRLMYPYFAFLEGTGLKIGFLNFTWTTTAFNRLIFIFSQKLSRILRKWFHFGVYFTLLIFLPFALWTLLSIVFNHLYVPLENSNAPEVKALLPGVNIPASDVWVYFLAVGTCTIIHELGHAMAATEEGVQLISVSFKVFAIMPIAMVYLNKDTLNSLSIFQRLKIICAGVWHNIALAFVTLLIFFSSPILFSIAYRTDLGVKVAGFSDDSPLNAKRGLTVGDVITSINGCDVKNSNDWTHCLHAAYERIGICTNEDYLTDNSNFMQGDVNQCCKDRDFYSICFEFALAKELHDLALPHQYACLTPRDMINNKLIKCTEQKNYWCPQNSNCLKPVLNNSTFLIVTERKNGMPVLYLGLPYDLHKTVIVDQYFPRNIFFSLFSPSQLEKFLKYTFIFSLGIGFLNVIPCYGTDGHHIARNLIQLLAKVTHKNDNFVFFVTVITVSIGTLITGPVIIYLFYKAIYHHVILSI